MDTSVIIPTWNRATSIGRAIDSVLAQTVAPREVIVVDDGSVDETRELIGDLFPQVRYLYQENRGVSAARNRGIRAARGSWIALLDSDDEWMPAKLERQRQGLQDNPQFLLCHCDEIWIRRGRRVNPMNKHAKHGGHIFRHCLPLCVLSPSAAVMGRDLLDEVGLFDETFPACEDYDLWLRVCARHPVLFIDEPLVRKHGGHDDQLSARFHGMDRYRVRALEKIIGSATLSPGDLHAAIGALVQKARIYANGAEKRGRVQEAARFRALITRYQAMAAAAPHDDSDTGKVPQAAVLEHRLPPFP